MKRNHDSLEMEREVAISIINLFENLLDAHNIMIPSPDRVGDEDEAAIYGEDYYNLEDNITDIIKDVIKTAKEEK